MSSPALRRLNHHVGALAPNPTAAANGDLFGQVKQAPLDPILGTKILFLKDNSPSKINLGIGAYRSNEGKPYVLKAVRKVGWFSFQCTVYVCCTRTCSCCSISSFVFSCCCNVLMSAH